MARTRLPAGWHRRNDRDLAAVLAQPLPSMLTRVTAADAKQSRLALEALVVRLLGFLNLKHVGTRRVTSSRPGIALDLLFEGETLFFRKWQVRCWRSAALAVDDVAGALGVLEYCGSDVGLVVCTGEVDPPALEFARTARRGMRQPMVIFDGEILVSLVENPDRVISTVRKYAPEALTPAG